MIKKITLLFVCSLMMFCFTTHAVELDCFELAGRDAKIDPDLLRAIAWHESRLNNQAIGDNAIAGFASGFGIGLMQIDSQHLKYLSQYGLDQDSLLSDICTNIYTGAYFLAMSLNRLGNTWDAVGAYNAGFSKRPIQEKRRRSYIRKVHSLYEEIKFIKRHHGI